MCQRFIHGTADCLASALRGPRSSNGTTSCEKSKVSWTKRWISVSLQLLTRKQVWYIIMCVGEFNSWWWLWSVELCGVCSISIPVLAYHIHTGFCGLYYEIIIIFKLSYQVNIRSESVSPILLLSQNISLWHVHKSGGVVYNITLLTIFVILLFI